MTTIRCPRASIAVPDSNITATVLPVNPASAIALVQHLGPQHESALPTLLASHTTIPVVQVMEGMRVESNHVFVIPPNVEMGRRLETDVATAGHAATIWLTGRWVPWPEAPDTQVLLLAFSAHDAAALAGDA